MSQTPPPAGPAANPDPSGWWAPPPAPVRQPAQSSYAPPSYPAQQQPGPWQQAPAQQQPGPWQQPPATQPPHQLPPYPPQPGYGAPFAPQPAAPVKKGRGKLIGSIVAVVVLAGGGVGTYVALSDSNQNGAATPTAAVQSVFDDLQKSDLLGVLDDLVPAERDALAAPLSQQVSELKRLHVFDSGADLHHLPGFTFATSGLTYGSPKRITDRVSVVALTGGTIDVSYDAARLPISQDFLSAVGGSVPKGSAATQHVNIADAPTRPELAVQQVGGRWYPSLFYTVGYNAVGQRAPSSSDYIPAVGADTPEDAAGDMVRALLKGDYRSAVQLLSPDEMAVVHDYGGSVTNSASGDSGVVISSLKTETTALSGGAQRISLKSVEMTKDGQSASMTVDGDCISETVGTRTQRFCAADIEKLVESFASGRVCASDGTCRPQQAPTMTAAQKQAFEDLFRGVLKIGIVTTSTDGKWYVNPVRTYGDLGNTITSQMKDDDLLQLIGFFKHLGH